VVANNGSDDATDVTIVDVVEQGFIFLPETIAGSESTNDSSPDGPNLIGESIRWRPVL